MTAAWMDAWFRNLVYFDYSNKRTYNSPMCLMPDSLSVKNVRYFLFLLKAYIRLRLPV